MNQQVEVPATELEISRLVGILSGADSNAALVVRKLAFERDRYKAALREIGHHSVCCDARHTADKALKPASTSQA